MNYQQAIAEFARTIDQPNSTNSAISPATQANMAVYRNNVRLNRANALQIAYPTIFALLGDEFFMAMADCYTEQTPCHSANLQREGEQFPAFIAQFAPAQPYPYLSDVAQFDWALHIAHTADDCTTLSAQSLAEYVDELSELIFTLHPAVSIIESPWPIASIYAMHHGQAAPQDLQQAESVLIWRDQYQVIDAANAQFLRQLQQAQPLAQALMAAASISANFDPAASLGQLISQQLIIKITSTSTASSQGALQK
ncbi:HvfC/BufC N-terminal domain-containing protein [Deefgea piscis]|uniref:HvfC/BufC N-terminal domain-containing protein n=1 Tax=Deefgea piscis TaxID=2739061 RepID=UPI001C7ED57C|nr:DNA-binding domain-containing protein [Deefgea piscis]QZA79679.1 putative DNA-binding domain-containing protein [Deefgea piscis]